MLENFRANVLKRPHSGTLKSGRLVEVGRLTEVPHKLDRKGSKHDFIASILENGLKSDHI